MNDRWLSVTGCLVAGLVTVGVAAPAGATSTRVVIGPHQSIQRAVDRAAPGTTIVVRPGTYHQTVTITKDRITLRGSGAGTGGTVLVPPRPLPTNLCAQVSGGSGSGSGICALGVIDLPSQRVKRNIRGVHISDLAVTGFPGNGVYGLGTDGLVVRHVRAANNGEYGIARFRSTRSRFESNVTTGNKEAGLYVGDSPEADSVVRGNITSGNEFGVFWRDSRQGTIADNDATGNCIGILVLNTPEPVAGGDVTVQHNYAHRNDKACPATDEAPPLSGIGVAVVSAHQARVLNNVIVGNHAGGPSAVRSGGVAAVTLPGPAFLGNAPTGNLVAHNVILRNGPPDLFWDRTGRGNLFVRNLCQKSIPSGLCPRGPTDRAGRLRHPAPPGPRPAVAPHDNDACFRGDQRFLSGCAYTPDDRLATRPEGFGTRSWP